MRGVRGARVDGGGRACAARAGPGRCYISVFFRLRCFTTQIESWSMVVRVCVGVCVRARARVVMA